MRQEMAAKMRAVLDDQRLVSLDTLFSLGDGLNKMVGGAPAGAICSRWPVNCGSLSCPGPSLPRAKKQNGRPESMPTVMPSCKSMLTSPK